ncbi:MAG: hypothetical protein FK733_09115 [Asgard group archaeon]|nr:hypothetical protein [Asgard group archaeon]
MGITRTQQKAITREKSLVSQKDRTFCLDCLLEWCSIRNTVTYCSQKYRGTNCYSCDDGKCSVKKIAGS